MTHFIKSLQSNELRGGETDVSIFSCWKSLKTDPLFSSKNDPPCWRIDYTASVDKSSGLVPGSPFFAGFLVGDFRLDSLCRNRHESLFMYCGVDRVRSESVTALELHHQISGQLCVTRAKSNTSGLPVATAP